MATSKSWTEDKDRLEDLAHSIDKSIRLCTKDNFVSKAIAWLLFLITFGRFKRIRFLQDFATTLGNYHFYPERWYARNVERVLIHEARHTKQFRWMGAGIHPLLGLPLAAVVYLLLPLPVLLAFGRFYMELDADKSAWKHMKNIGATDIAIIGHATRRAASLSSASYVWALPKSWTEKRYIAAAQGICDEHNKA